jgi:hypothetical protein
VELEESDEETLRRLVSLSKAPRLVPQHTTPHHHYRQPHHH